MMFHDYFKVISGMFHISFKVVLINVYRFLMDILWMFQASFEEVARIFQECFKGIEKAVSEVFQRSFKVV